MLASLSRVAVLLVVLAATSGNVIRSPSSHSDFIVNSEDQTFRFVRMNVSDEVSMGLTIPNGTESVPCGEGDVCLDYGTSARLVVTTQDHCQRVVWTAGDLGELKDCVTMKGHWYGGGEQMFQRWPIETEPRIETAYVTGDMLQLPRWYGGVTEAYWISSQGIAVVVDETTPLFLSLVDVDDDGVADEMCLAARLEAPFAAEEGSPLMLDYTICSADDVRQVHEQTLPMFYGRPTATPDDRMFREPIWCTWAEYKTDVDEAKVLEMAYNIIENGYPYSQIEIDDNWETCYGDAVFNKEKFPDPKDMMDQLHALGYRVTLWIHPFINDDCDAFTFPDQNGYFVKDGDNNTQLTSWWQGTSSGIIDFTNPEAVDWWRQRLLDLQANTGIDSFKFDAGETNWLPDVFTLNADRLLWPNIYSTSYVKAVSSFGGLVEVRTGRRNQGDAVFFRMLDKNSNWSYGNGLKTLLTTLLHFGILGYPFVLPDMIGGNAYVGQPSEELFIRWTQANAFMPSMQFSLLPWEFGDTANAVAVNVSRLHVEYTPQILQAAAEAAGGSVAPINRPTWWLCPTNEACLTADQQYLLGDDILVAPVTDEGSTEKTVVFPPGDWLLSSNGATYSGPDTYTFPDVPLNTLLFFTRT